MPEIYKMPSSFEIIGIDAYGPRLRHKTSEFTFRRIRGEIFEFGLSKTEEEQILSIDSNPYLDFSEMRPCDLVEIKEFLVMECPLTCSQVRAQGFAQFDSSADVAFAKRDIFLQIAERYGFSLISEAQWEFTIKKGCSGLIPFAPNDREDIIEPWMQLEVAPHIPKNNFGISILYSGEWCIDRYSKTHASAFIADLTGVDAYVIKGGAAYFWPWQDKEWLWCIPSVRHSSADLPEGEATCRLVFNL